MYASMEAAIIVDINQVKGQVNDIGISAVVLSYYKMCCLRNGLLKLLLDS